jgi:hypothetical protein
VIEIDSQSFTLAGRAVRRVGFGAMQLPGPGVFGPPKDHDQALHESPGRAAWPGL